MEREVACDPGKRARLLQTREIDLLRMDRVFSDPFRIEYEDLRRDYGETRKIVIAIIGGAFFTVVYTQRDNVTWLITAWTSNRKERERYARAREDRLQDRA